MGLCYCSLGKASTKLKPNMGIGAQWGRRPPRAKKIHHPQLLIFLNSCIKPDRKPLRTKSATGGIKSYGQMKFLKILPIFLIYAVVVVRDQLTKSQLSQLPDHLEGWFLYQNGVEFNFQ